MTELTYDRLQSLAATLLEARVSVVIDSASLRAAERRDLARIATAHGCPATVVACEAPAAVLEARVAARTAAGRDPSDATLDVLARQRLWQEPRAPEEPPWHTIDTDCAAEELLAHCAALARKLAASVC
jgi:hypothetical protein